MRGWQSSKRWQLVKGGGGSGGSGRSGGGGGNVSVADLEAKGWSSVEAANHAATISKSPNGAIKDAVAAALGQSPDSPDLKGSGIRSRIQAMAEIGGRPGKSDRGVIGDAFGMAMGTSGSSSAGKALSLQLERTYSRMSETQKNVLARRLQRDGFLSGTANHPALVRIQSDAQRRVEALQPLKFQGANFTRLFR